MRHIGPYVTIPAIVLFAFLFNEFFVYYLYLYAFCDWPDVKTESHCIKSLVLSDPHLLGQRRGHFFDKLRREWQMHRSFVTADNLFHPHLIIMLGDILDEGEIASSSQFEEYVERFHSVFPIRQETQSIIIAGNHDVGFHDRMIRFEPVLRQRFDKSFNSSLVQVKEINLGQHNLTLISLNSMAMEGDDCYLCSKAEAEVLAISRDLEKNVHRPVLLSHFPLFRISDEKCSEPDSADDEEKTIEFRSRLDCMSEQASEFLISNLKPRLVLTGHTHNGCVMQHKYGGHEVWSVTEHTVASFSWRNRADPSFLMIAFCPDDVVLINKCFIPNEWLILMTYTLASFAILAYSLYNFFWYTSRYDCLLKKD